MPAAPTSTIVSDMIRIVKSGQCVRIRYARDEAGTAGIDRTIIPIKLIEGLDDTVVRAIQVQPDYGTRGFRLAQILSVAPSGIPLGPAAERTKHFVSNTVLRVDRAVSPREPVASAGGAPGPAPISSPCAWNDAWFREYMLSLHGALLDESISDEEFARLQALQTKLGLSKDQISAVHSYVLGQELLAMSVDGIAATQERDHLSLLQNNLARLGWSGR